MRQDDGALDPDDDAVVQARQREVCEIADEGSALRHASLCRYDARLGNLRVNEGRFHNDALLVGSEWLADRLADSDLRIVEVTPPGSGYVFAHLPGAVYLSLDDLFTGRASGIHRTVGPLGEVVDTLGRLGLSPDRHVVVYDANGGAEAAQVFWLLEYLGFERVSALEGGAERWMAEERAQTAEVPSVVATTFNGRPRDDRLATAEWIAARLGDGDIRVLDCRTFQEFSEGHIPGAQNRSWDRTLRLDAYQRFREAVDLRAELEALGITPSREIVTYCHTGQRSAHTYLTLRLLGYPRVRNYDASWTEWGERPDLPKASGA